MLHLNDMNQGKSQLQQQRMFRVMRKQSLQIEYEECIIPVYTQEIQQQIEKNASKIRRPTNSFLRSKSESRNELWKVKRERFRSQLAKRNRHYRNSSNFYCSNQVKNMCKPPSDSDQHFERSGSVCENSKNMLYISKKGACSSIAESTISLPNPKVDCLKRLPGQWLAPGTMTIPISRECDYSTIPNIEAAITRENRSDEKFNSSSPRN